MPDINEVAKPTSEAKEELITLSLLADDTTTLGESREIPEGVNVVKDVMGEFEESKQW